MKSAQSNEAVCLELLRVSTPKQVELGGMDSQHEDCVKIAALNRVGLHPEPIRLAGVSGKNVKLTPEIQQLQDLLRTGKFAGVVMVEDTRLMRADEPEDYALLQVFKDMGAKIYTKSSVHDMSTPEGMMMFQILIAIAGRERHVIRQRTYSKREKLRSKGLLASAAHTLPVGVTRVRYRDGDADRWAYTYDEIKMSAVRRAFELVIAGETSYRTIASETNLSYFSVPEILRNTIYIGYRTYSQRVDPKRDVMDEFGRLRYQVKVRRPDDEIERVPMLGADGKPLAPAIPPDTFWRVQEILKLKTEMHWRRNTTDPERYLFRGFLRCAHCGQRLISVSHRAVAGGSIRDYYVCRSSYGARYINAQGESRWADLPDCHAPRVRREALDEMLNSMIPEKLADPTWLFKLLQAHAAASLRGDNGQRIAQAKREIAALETEKRQSVILFKKSRISEGEFDRDCERLDAALKAAERHLHSLVPVASTITAQALAYAVAPFERWGLLKTTMDEKRALLTAVCPEFNILIEGNGGRGAGAKTTVRVVGSWLHIGQEPATDSFSSENQLVNDVAHTPTGYITDQLPIYIPFNYFQLQP